jgi:phosphoribosylformylglycinamidine synthase subunit PurQ / glutaminase
VSASRGGARVAVLTFPGSNSEEETVRACEAAGLDTARVHWTADLAAVRRYAAYVLPGGFAYEDRVRAGAIAAHDRLMEAVVDGAEGGKLVLGICNGAQILAEAGLVPGTGPAGRPQAGFARNAPSGKFLCRHMHVRLAIPPERCAMTASLPANAVIPVWVAHGEGRLAAHRDELLRIERGGHLAFVYCAADGAPVPAPNGSALGTAGLTNRAGNVLAIMPHPERDAWTFQHADGALRERARGDARAMLAPSGGNVLFVGLARALATA